MSLGEDARSAAPKRVTVLHVAKMDELIKKDRCVTVHDISGAVGLIGHGTVHTIIVDTLKFSKECAQWIPAT